MANLAGLMPPGARGYLGAEEAAQEVGTRNLANIQHATQIRGQLEALQATQQLKDALAQAGGDPEKAMEAALKTGNVAAAQHLAPLVKIKQAQREQQSTVEGLRGIYGMPPSNAVPAPPGAPAPQPVEGQPVAPVAQPLTPQDSPKQARIQQLQQMSLLPAYANNAVVQQRIQAEIDKLQQESKPMIEHNFSIGDNQVQPHISLDGGKTWKPIPGSQPSAKFAKQVVNVNTGGGEPVAATDDTLRMDAYRYLTDGTLPPNMGRGLQGSQQATKIRNEASRIASEELKIPVEEVRMLNLTNKAGVSAVMQLGKARAQILQAEKLANYNADLALTASNAASRSGVPLLNKGVQWAQENLAGDPKLREFTIANETFISEYAKVMGGGYGAAAPTEGAQARAHTILNKATTKEEYIAGVKQLKKEMENRVRSLNDQMNEETGRLRSGLGRPAPAAATPPAPSAGGWAIVR